MKLTKENLNDLINALRIARDTLPIRHAWDYQIKQGERWAELEQRYVSARDSLDRVEWGKTLRETIKAMEGATEVQCDPDVPPVTIETATGPAYEHDIDRHVAKAKKLVDECLAAFPVFPDACLEGRWEPHFQITRKKNGKYRVIEDNELQDELTGHQAALRAKLFEAKLKNEQAIRDILSGD